MPTPRTARSAPSKPPTPPARAPAVVGPVPKARSTRSLPATPRPVRKTRSTRSAPKLARPVRQVVQEREPDAVIRTATGRSWAQWFRLLDRFDVAAAGRSATVRHLAEAHDCPRWWRQHIASAHAEARGLQAPAAPGLAANTSRTLSVSVDDLYRAWQGRAPGKWLQTKFKVHRANANKSLRLDWPDHTSVEIYFWAKGERRSQVNVMHRQLSDASEVAAKKAFWSEALDKLQAALE
ncbi:hypothetical protein [Nannocystis sp.]|uniref:hypothetical protein n=1 Tax=Nannocystis sp. TaxID=1962667 RepID=UPI0024219FE5|nr:hypothetical protein [Nannocystis sp.]MBK7825271.1 hypothetical protein [Nannocystis sp.]MBK9756869.1 hypothetical protein [Nannocystis sp.]